jgi:hypothetical protein
MILPPDILPPDILPSNTLPRNIGKPVGTGTRMPGQGEAGSERTAFPWCSREGGCAV